VPINRALAPVVRTAQGRHQQYLSASQTPLIGGVRGAWRTTLNYAWFVGQMNHGAPWDIKRESVWNTTIGYGTFPGVAVMVFFSGMLMTPESLGNFTYGYIGGALGFDLGTLLAGSFIAAGFPEVGTPGWNNEVHVDWWFVEAGLNAFHRRP